MSKINIGKMPCETCGNQVTVKQNENGTLSYRCDECDAAPYAKTGTLQNEHWRGKLTGLQKAEPSEQVKAEVKKLTPAEIKTATTAQTEVKKINSIFGEL